MASVASDPGGKKRILVVVADGSRKTIYLGKITLADAKGIARYIQGLVDARVAGITPARDVSSWLAGVGKKLWTKLVRLGLVDSHTDRLNSLTLSRHLESYFARRQDVKPATLQNWRHTQRCLLAYFGPDRSLATITVGEAEDWQRWLRTGNARKNRYDHQKTSDGLSPATVGKRTQNAIQFFQDAVKREQLAKNPFAGLRCEQKTNKKRVFFVTRDMAAKVLDTIPDAEWRLIFALSRFGGLRCPSETLSLRWKDIHWAEGRMLVRVPKLERIAGKETRVVPIFPELRPHLDAAREQAGPGAEFVIQRYRIKNSNLRTQLLRFLAMAGIKAWPKLFTNLRASMATELASQFPAHVEAEWVGHSEKIARDHYLQVTEADFARALAGVEKVAQNPAQQNPEMARPLSHLNLKIGENHQKSDDLRGSTGNCGGLQKNAMGVLGGENPLNSP